MFYKHPCNAKIPNSRYQDEVKCTLTCCIPLILIINVSSLFYKVRVAKLCRKPNLMNCMKEKKNKLFIPIQVISLPLISPLLSTPAGIISCGSFEVGFLSKKNFERY